MQNIQEVKFENFRQKGIAIYCSIYFYICRNSASLVSKNIVINSTQHFVFIDNANIVTINDNISLDTRDHYCAAETRDKDNNAFSNDL